MNPPDAVCRIVEMAHHRIGISTNLRVMPYVRMTQRSKHRDPRSRAYNASQRAINEVIGVQMGVDGAEPFLAGVGLGFGATIWLAPVRQAISTSWKMPHTRTTHPGLHTDLGNLVKALEDALQGVLYRNDKQIREYGRCRVLEGEEDRFEVEVWEL